MHERRLGDAEIGIGRLKRAVVQERDLSRRVQRQRVGESRVDGSLQRVRDRVFLRPRNLLAEPLIHRCGDIGELAVLRGAHAPRSASGAGYPRLRRRIRGILLGSERGGRAGRRASVAVAVRPGPAGRRWQSA